MVRQGFVQALQTAHTTAALMRGRGGEARSKAEHAQRMADASAKEQRSITEHRIRVYAAVETANQTRELNAAKIAEVHARTNRGAELHELDKRHKTRQIERGDADLARREAAGEMERKQKIEVHTRQIAGYDNREARAVEVHALEVEYKKLLLDIRRRTAGFSDSLTQLGEPGTAMASAAAFASAQTAEGLSDQHQQAATAYRARLVEDTDLDIDENLADLAAAWEEAGPWTAALEDLAGLTEHLSVATHLEQELGVLADEPEADINSGSAIDDAINATGVTSMGSYVAAVIDPDLDSDPLDPTPSLAPQATDTGLEP